MEVLEEILGPQLLVFGEDVRGVIQEFDGGEVVGKETKGSARLEDAEGFLDKGRHVEVVEGLTTSNQVHGRVCQGKRLSWRNLKRKIKLASCKRAFKLPIPIMLLLFLIHIFLHITSV